MLFRSARPAVAGAFLIGSLGGALTTSTGLLVLSGLVSPVPASLRALVAILVLALLGVHQAGILRLPLPQRAHQIPREVFHRSPTAGARRFAYELGTGVRTYITTTASYGVATVLVLAAPASLGAAILGSLAAGVGFGIGRSVVVLSHAWRKRVAVDHPSPWLQLAAWCSLLGSASIAVRALLGA